jgi:hypothetical protein
MIAAKAFGFRRHYIAATTSPPLHCRYYLATTTTPSIIYPQLLVFLYIML